MDPALLLVYQQTPRNLNTSVAINKIQSGYLKLKTRVSGHRLNPSLVFKVDGLPSKVLCSIVDPKVLQFHMWETALDRQIADLLFRLQGLMTVLFGHRFQFVRLHEMAQYLKYIKNKYVESTRICLNKSLYMRSCLSDLAQTLQFLPQELFS